MTRKHIHEEEFQVTAERMFELLITPSEICKWWGAARAIVLPEQDGIWMAAWGKDEDKPDYVSAFTMAVFEPPNRILFDNAKYSAKGNEPSFMGGITAEFLVAETELGCSLKVVQDGFPDDTSADSFYKACETGWKDTFRGIRTHLES